MAGVIKQPEEGSIQVAKPVTFTNKLMCTVLTIRVSIPASLVA